MAGMYRGLTKEGKVVLGCLFHHVTRAFIIDEYEMTEGLCTISSTPRSISGWIEVLPESLAQFTGKHDKNKKPIYGSFEIDGFMTEGGDVVKGVNMHTMKVMWGIRRLGWCVQFTDRNTQYLEPMDDELFRDYKCEVIIEGGE